MRVQHPLHLVGHLDFVVFVAEDLHDLQKIVAVVDARFGVGQRSKEVSAFDRQRFQNLSASFANQFGVATGTVRRQNWNLEVSAKLQKRPVILELKTRMKIKAFVLQSKLKSKAVKNYET